MPFPEDGPGNFFWFEEPAIEEGVIIIEGEQPRMAAPLLIPDELSPTMLLREFSEELL